MDIVIPYFDRAFVKVNKKKLREVAKQNMKGNL